MGRGAEGYRQAHEYIVAGNPGRSARWYRNTALRYLTITATPPLTKEEWRAAKRESRITPLANTE